MNANDSPRSDEHYFERIERQFGVRRGGPLLLSPRDWQLVSQWREIGIPLDVVLLGINRAFDAVEAFYTPGPPQQRVNSLSYCRQQIETAWEAHREQQAAETLRDAPETAVTRSAHEQHLHDAADACRRAAMRAVLTEPGRQLLTDTANALVSLAAPSAQCAQPSSSTTSGPPGADPGQAAQSEPQAALATRTSTVTTTASIEELDRRARELHTRLLDGLRVEPELDGQSAEEIWRALRLPPLSPWSV